MSQLKVIGRKFDRAFRQFRNYANAGGSKPLILGPQKGLIVKVEGDILSSQNLRGRPIIDYQLHKSDLKSEPQLRQTFLRFIRDTETESEILDSQPIKKTEMDFLNPVERITLRLYKQFNHNSKKIEEISSKSIGNIFNHTNQYDPNQYRFDEAVRNAELCLKAKLMGPMNVPTPLLGLMHKLGILLPILEPEEGPGSRYRDDMIYKLNSFDKDYSIGDQKVTYSEWLIKEYEDHKAGRTDIDVTGRYAGLFGIYNQKSYISQPEEEIKSEAA